MINPLARLEGKYEILEKIQEGGMGAIYKVRHLLLDELRVIKVMRPHLRQDPSLRERFLAEGRAAARLSHPNIARIFDCTLDEEGVAYLVMEFIPGWTLGDLLRRNEMLPLDLCLAIAKQSLDAIGHMHLHKMVHRDIAPDNLILGTTVDGRPMLKLIDLGIAKATEGGSQLTDAGVFIGKFRYAAPELFDETSPRNEPRSDLYSLALVLYELMTLQFPISGSTSSSLIAGHLFRPPLEFAVSDPQGRLPDTVRRALLKGLAKSPDERFNDAADFAAALPSVDLAKPSEAVQKVLVLTAQPRPESTTSVYRSGSTQAQFDAQFAPIVTPAPHSMPSSGSPGAASELPTQIIPSLAEQLAPDNPLHRLAATDPDASTVILLPDAPAPEAAASAPAPDLHERTAILLAEAQDRAAREDFTAARQVLDHLLQLDASHDGARKLRHSLETLVEVQLEETRRTEILAHRRPPGPVAVPSAGVGEATETVATPEMETAPTATLSPSLDQQLQQIRDMQQAGDIGLALQALQRCVQEHGSEPRLNALRNELGLALLARDAEQQQSAIDPFGTVTAMNPVAPSDAPLPSPEAVTAPAQTPAAPGMPEPPTPPTPPTPPLPEPPSPPLADGPLARAETAPGESPAPQSFDSPIDHMLPSNRRGGTAAAEAPLAQLTLDGRTTLEELHQVEPLAPTPQALDTTVARSSVLPAHQNQRSLLIGGIVLVALFALLGVLLSRYRPATEVEGLAAEDVVAAQLSPGFLELDARPWGEIELLEDQNGESPILNPSRQTPVMLSLPPGTYRLVLKYPPANDSRELTLDIRSGEVTELLEVFRTIDSETYLRVQQP